MKTLAKRLAKRPLTRILRSLGYKLTPLRPQWPQDFTRADIELCREVGPHTMTSPEATYTMTSPEAIIVLAHAVRHVVANEIPGAFVECGVWKGGSMMAVARTLLNLGRDDRALYLFDTFEGMSEPTRDDVRWTGEPASDLLAHEMKDERSCIWAWAPLLAVQQAVHSVGYPPENIHFVEGKVEETIPREAPEQIALLRLDTDWYESTRHELTHLYPRLAVGGVLIIDDYGWWRGARKATDEYFQAHPPAPLLVRIDDAGRRIAVKL
jgi:O-methyltransferase